MAEEASPKVPAKEYFLVEMSPLRDMAGIQKQMTEYGKQGWIFIHADGYYHDPDKLRVWFMR